MDGWPNEKWVDTRNAKVRTIMKNRLLLAASKKCDGVDPDNVDGYGNDSGFNLSQDDGVDYINFLASTAHSLGMAYGLKNAGDIVDRVVNVSQWVIQEQCAVQQPSECWQYQPFIKQNKPVFHVEYTSSKTPSTSVVNRACTDTGATGFSNILKHTSLDAWTQTC